MREASPSISEAVNAFLDDVAIRLAPLTRVTYAHHLRPLRALDWPLTDTVCRQLVADQVRAGKAPRTVNTFAGVLMAFVKFCRAEGWLYTDPTAHLSTPRIEEKPHRYLSADEVARIRRAAEEMDDEAARPALSSERRPTVKQLPCVPRDFEHDDSPTLGQHPYPFRDDGSVQSTRNPLVSRSRHDGPTLPGAASSPSYRLIVSLLLTGLRAAELLAIRREDIDDGLITVRGKGARWRYVPLPDEAIPLLPASGLLFPFVYKSLHKYVRQLGTRAGIVRLHPHLFRHTWASLTLIGGVNPTTLQTVGGWQSQKMVEHYTRSVFQKAAAREMARFSLTPSDEHKTPDT